MRTRPRDKSSEKNVVVQELGSYPGAGPFCESNLNCPGDLSLSRAHQLDQVDHRHHLNLLHCLILHRYRSITTIEGSQREYATSTPRLASFVNRNVVGGPSSGRDSCIRVAHRGDRGVINWETRTLRRVLTASLRCSSRPAAWPTPTRVGRLSTLTRGAHMQRPRGCPEI